MEQHLMDALTAGGMDLTATLARFGGNETLLLKYLSRFCDDPNFATLETAVTQADWARAAASCHTLKGVSGNLGLLPLYRACGAMMACLRAEEYAQAASAFATVQAEYHRTLALLQATL